ncbi:HK97 family phage prohead protease [Candidatus Pacearchaeota archaeon]|jgi:HK97 family phage prohead protease|nr:HK97 family phage prohead protease [Candidatus Pacearchaeota archaeon]
MNKYLSGVMVKKDAKENRYTIAATTDDLDRQGERVLPGGVTNLDHFLKYGSILADHDWSVRAIIGKPLSAKSSDKALLLDIQFADTQLGQEIKYLFDEGFASSFSIGFLPEMEKIDIIDGVRTYKAWELLEVSAVPVPANASATILRDAASRRGAPLSAIAKMLASHEEAEGTKGAAPARDPEAITQNQSESKRVDIADTYISTRSSI